MPGRKMQPVTRGHKFVTVLFENMIAQNIGVNHMSDRSGVSANTLSDWRTRTMPNIPNLDACLNVVGKKLIVVPIDFDETTL